VQGGNSGYVLSTDGTGNLSWVSGSTALAGGSNVFLKSNVTNIVAGSALNFSVDYSNTAYPGGIFTIEQLGPISLNVTDSWASGGSSKNAYANYVSNTINTQSVSITLSLANANFSIQSSDTITINGSTITGSNLTGLNIANTGGTFTIPSSMLSTTVQTQLTNTVSVSLTTNRGLQTGSGTTLTNNQPVPFNVTALSGTFTSSTVPYWSLNQTFNWNATTTSGAANIIGNVTYSNATLAVSGSLTSAGAISGASTSLDSTYSYALSSSDYNGDGQYGAGKRTMTGTVTGTVSPATKYYPLFWKTTSDSTIPTFTTSDSHNSTNFTVGQGANTTTSPTSYLWLATPNNTAHTFKHIFLGSDIVDSPDVSGNINISGQAYRVWGFTNFSQVTPILTTT
jgi:hypothetical protein